MRLFKFLLPIVFCGALLSTLHASPDSARTTRLLHKLEGLPRDGAPFSVVNKLLMELIRRNPVASYAYIQVALDRIAWDGRSNATWTLEMQKRIWLIVKKSNLPSGQKESVLENVNRSFQDLWWPHPPPSPTPTPSPTP
jgi:hypothetical protein